MEVYVKTECVTGVHYAIFTIVPNFAPGEMHNHSFNDHQNNYRDVTGF